MANRKGVDDVIVTNEVIIQSILELREIYKDKTDKEFIRFYSKRYSVSENAIVNVLNKYYKKEAK